MQITPISADHTQILPQKGEKGTILGLQGLRFFAASIVVVTHTLNREVNLYHPYPLPRAPWMEAGVDIFFVISGFIMVYIIKPETAAGRFWLQRFTRIVPLYWIATIVAYIGCVTAPDWFFGHQGWWFALRSLLFIPTGDNSWAHPILSPGWTLVYEFAFYTLLALCLTLRKPPFATSAVVIVAVVSVGMLLKPWLPFMGFYADEALLLEFLFGMGAAVLAREHGFRPWQGPLIAALGLVLIYFLWDFQMGWPRGLKAGLPAFLVVFGTLVSEPLWQRSRALQGISRLGDASYSIYLVHFFFVTAIATFCTKNPQFTQFIGAYTFTIGTVVIGIGAGLLAHLFIEKPLLKLVRSWLDRGPAPKLAPAAAKV
ncbi:MAG: acyltransferase [Devosia sp.]|nr:acyltransferase [Devosia sp.]